MDLLRIIAGRQTDGWLEVRWFPNDKTGARQDWFELTDPEGAAKFIANRHTEADMFVGCAPRLLKAGGKAAIEQAWCLWADLDTPESVEALRKFRPLPTLVVRSGTGSNLHAYWSLENPAPAEWIERANRRLAHALGADPRCAEVARILRPPNSLNHKHTPAAKVEQIAGTGKAHSVLMVADLPDPPNVRFGANPAQRTNGTLTAKRHTKRGKVGDSLLGISAQEYVPRLTGREVTSSGHIICPWHKGGQERTPSFMCYPEPSQGWMCFGCGEGGDIYAFGARLWGMATTGIGFVQLREKLERELL